MQWEKSAADKLDKLVQVVRDPLNEIIKNSAQADAKRYVAQRQKPHVTLKDAVLGFLRARSHKVKAESSMLLKECGIDEKEFIAYGNNGVI